MNRPNALLLLVTALAIAGCGAGMDSDEQFVLSDTSSSLPKAPSQDLEVGSTGPAVEQLQRCLAALGFFPLSEAAPHFGSKTQSALAHFQLDYGVKDPDGQVYKAATRGRLSNALAARAKILGTPLYSQLDPRWAEERYVFGGGSLGGLGCTLTTVGIGAQWVSGRAYTPAWVNASRAHYSAALAVDDTQVSHLAKGLRWLSERQPDAVMGIEKGTSAAAALLRSVRASVSGGEVVALGMTFPAGIGAFGWTRHTVLVTAIDSDGALLINDPANGTQRPLVNYTGLSAFAKFDVADAVRR